MMMLLTNVTLKSILDDKPCRTAAVASSEPASRTSRSLGL